MNNPPDIHQALNDRDRIADAFRRARREAIQRHKQAGVPMAIWRNGKVMLIPAEQLEAELDKPRPNGAR